MFAHLLFCFHFEKKYMKRKRSEKVIKHILILILTATQHILLYIHLWKSNWLFDVLYLYARRIFFNRKLFNCFYHSMWQVPPTNQTKLEGEKAIFTCEAKAMPGNVTVRWFREGSPVREVASLETRVTIRKDGSLIINPVSADDSGQYLCEGEVKKSTISINTYLLLFQYFTNLYLVIYFKSSAGSIKWHWRSTKRFGLFKCWM